MGITRGKTGIRLCRQQKTVSRFYRISSKFLIKAAWKIWKFLEQTIKSLSTVGSRAIYGLPKEGGVKEGEHNDGSQLLELGVLAVA